MPNLTDLTGLAGISFATSSSMLLLTGAKRLDKLLFSLLVLGMFVLLLIPFMTLPLAGYFRGVTGDLSITTLVLLGHAMWRISYSPAQKDTKNPDPMLTLIGFSALVFYPMALGASSIDPYRLGYGSLTLVMGLLVITLLAWYLKLALVAMCITLGTLAWSLGWYESQNIWDYLLDPFVSLYSLFAIISFELNKVLKCWQP